MSDAKPWVIERLAGADHERGCRNEPEWPYISISHRHVHETNALRQYARGIR